MVRVWCGGSCHLEAVPTSGPKMDLDWVRPFWFPLQDEGEFPLHFPEVTLSKESLVSLNALPSSLWKVIGWKKKQLICTPLSLSLVYHLSASLAFFFLSSNPERAEYRHFYALPLGVRCLCCAAGLHIISFNNLCRLSGNALFLFCIPFRSVPWGCQHYRDFRLKIFPPFFALCSAASCTFLELQPGPGSWHGVWFQRKVSSGCCSCESCLRARLLFT